MRTHAPAHRALDVVLPFTIYLVIGRRPSGIYVDGALRATTVDGGATTQPLWDLVFEAATAHPGDQVQDRPGGIVLVGRDGAPRSVQLTPPTPRLLENAFTHAERVLAADRAEVERLVTAGNLAIAPVRRIKQPPPPTAKVVFAGDHPLVTGRVAPA